MGYNFDPDLRGIVLKHIEATGGNTAALRAKQGMYWRWAYELAEKQAQGLSVDPVLNRDINIAYIHVSAEVARAEGKAEEASCLDGLVRRVLRERE